MRVLFDLNVLLDVFMDRSPWVDDSKAAVKLVLDRKITGYISAISVTTLFYITRRSVGAEQARDVVERCLAIFEIAAVDQLVLLAALSHRGGDFEDRVQLSSAQAAGLDALVTRDLGGFDGSELPILTPHLLLQKAG